MIRERIQQAINKRLAYDSPFNVVPEPASTAFDDRIPTLKNGVWEKASPMSQARFVHCGRWLSATHGSWLSISDMETLWQEHTEDTFLDEITRSCWIICFPHLIQTDNKKSPVSRETGDFVT